jgi:phosphate-selective porin OprO/OprP
LSFAAFLQPKRKIEKVISPGTNPHFVIHQGGANENASKIYRTMHYHQTNKSHVRQKCFLIGIGALVPIVQIAIQPLEAQTSSEAERLEKLEYAVEQLQKQNGELEQRNSHLEKEIKALRKEVTSASAVPAERSTQRTVTSDGKASLEKSVPVDEKPPIYVAQRGPEIKLTLGGFVQMNFEDGAVSAFEGRFPDGPNEIKDRFRLRRARITLTGDFAENFDFKVEGDFGQSDGISSNRTAFSATDIFVNWHQFPEANVKVGQWKTPFGLEQLTPATKLFTIERSLPTIAIVPQREIGVEIWGQPLTNLWPQEKDLLTYYAGIFNGNGRNTTINDNNNFMYVGRLELLPWEAKLLGQDSSLKLGADILNSRDDAGTNISQLGNLKVNADGSLTPFTLPSADERTAWSLDAWLSIGPFDLIGEYLSEDVDGRTVAGVAPKFANFEPSGWYVQGSYFIIPKKLQAVVKWEELSPDQVADDGIRSITGGLNYYIHGDSIKLMANYVHTWSDFREEHPQFGDDQFDEVIMRLQLMF